MIQDASRPFVSLKKKLPSRPDLHGCTSRRSSERRPVNVKVEIDGKPGDAWAINLSNGGVRIVAEARLEVGEQVFLRMGDRPETGLQGKGRVVWVREQGEDVVAGIEFLEAA